MINNYIKVHACFPDGSTETEFLPFGGSIKPRFMLASNQANAYYDAGAERVRVSVWRRPRYMTSAIASISEDPLPVRGEGEDDE